MPDRETAPEAVVTFGSEPERQAAVEALRLRLAAISAKSAPGLATSPGLGTALGLATAPGPATSAGTANSPDPVNAVDPAAPANPHEEVQPVPIELAVELTGGEGEQSRWGSEVESDSESEEPRPFGERGKRGQKRDRGQKRERGQRRRREPGELSEEQLADPETAARNICLRLLTDSARPRANLFSALLKRGIDEDVANKVLDRYTEVGLIDDDAYAHAYVRTKHKERGLGRRALAMELRRKGIEDSIAVQALEEVNSDDERSRGQLLLSKRISAAMAAGPEAARRRMLGLLARRGYTPEMSYELVNSALRDYGLEQSDSQYVEDSL